LAYKADLALITELTFYK